MNTKILIVENEEVIAADIEEKLEDLGYNVSAIVSSGEEAIKKTEETRPDLVLMDIVLKGDMDGIESAKQIRTHFDIPVIYLTAYADDTTLERAKITEPFGYILKPFEERELEAAIKMALHKHQIERKIKESSSWFCTTLKSIGDAVIVTDTNGFISFMNSVAETMTGWTQDEAIGKDLIKVLNIIDEETRTPIENPIKKVLREEVTVNLDSGKVLLAKDGMERFITDSAAPIKDDKGKIIGVVLVFMDITERKRTEEELKDSRQQLRGLLARLQSVQEEERRRIAFEIYDKLGQMLAGLKLNLSWLDKKLSESGSGLLPLVHEIKSVSNLTDAIFQTVEQISTALRPMVLDELDLIAAIEWQVQEFQTRTGIECKFISNLKNITLDKEYSVAIFRIFQEALTNVARHANATKVNVSLNKKADNLVFKVKDKGKGISESDVSNPKSLGLLGMRERALLMGGEVQVTGTSGKGTTVILKIPLRNKRPL
ncbi:MAG TPA: response regulator [Thermodesulfobacteriota bacterium]|nr:response regulator [Thermodesulfobacteriota bacterium]